MPLSPEQEARYQQLGSQLGFLQAPIQAAPEQTGFLGFTGQSLASILPGALEKIVQPAQTLLGFQQPDEIPRFFDTRAPEGIGEHIVAGAAEFASYLPAIAMTEGAGIAGLQGLGASARVAKIGGSALGFGLSMAPQGGETAAVQGGVGALQTAAGYRDAVTGLSDFGWRGKLAAGILVGAAGYYEGAKGENGSPTQGAVYGALNLLGPTLIDPALAHITGANKVAAARAKDPAVNPPVLPNQSRGPIPFSVSPDGPKDVGAFKLAPTGPVTENKGLPFYEVPPTLQPAPIVGQVARPGGIAPPIVEGLNANRMQTPRDITAPPSPTDSYYGRGTDPLDVFAGVQRPPILSPGETFPFGQEATPTGFRRGGDGGIFPIRDLPQVPSEPGFTGTDFTYGRQTDVPDIFTGLQQRPSTAALSPEETAAKIRFEASKPAPEPTPPPAPVSKGLRPKLEDTVPAVRAGKESIRGLPGETHQDIMDRLMIEDPDKWMEALDTFGGPKDANHFQTTGGRELSRDELFTHFGVRDSQGLRDMQSGAKAKAPTEFHPVVGAALRMKEGPPLLAKPGENHFMLAARAAGEIHPDEAGSFFTTKPGEILSRDEAGARMQHKGDLRAEDIASPPPKAQPVEPATAKAASVRVKGKFGWEDAEIVGHDGDTLHVVIKDPIFGDRQASVLRQDTLPPKEVTAVQKPEGGGGTVPFKDVPGARNMLDRADERFGGEGGMLASPVEGAGPVRGAVHNLSGTLALTVAEGIKKLPPEAGRLVAEILSRIETASGQTLDTSLALRMPGTKGSAYKTSGRIALNLQWINGIVKNWEKLSPTNRDNAMMRIAALFGHEASHVAHRFAERSNLTINGQNITDAIVQHVDGLNQAQREYIIGQIQKLKGDPSTVISKYLSGDIDAVYGYYKRFNQGLTREEAKKLAAGEVMAEIGAVELIKRVKVEGLPTTLREAVDKFKQVLVNVVNWFKGQNDASGVAGLQGLSDIANKMFDHFAAADTTELGRAFPASEVWKAGEAIPSPSISVPTPPKPITPSLITQPYAKMELARLGIRSLVGAGIGGAVGPSLSDHHMSFAESAIAGGVMGAFGPMMIKAIANTSATQELIAAAKVAKGGSFAGLKALMQGDKLRDLGAEARYGWRGDGSFAAKIVRTLESEMKVNFDPKLKAVYEQARGIMGYRLAMIEKALKDSRWVRPSEGVLEATTNFIEGKIGRDEYRNLLTDDGSKLYGELMITAREATSIGTDNIAAGMRKSALREAIIQNNESYVGRFYKAYRKGEFDMSYFDKVKADIMTMNPGLDIHNADALLREHMVEIKANRELFSGKRGTGAQALDSKIQFRRRATEEEIYMQQLEVAHHEHNPYGAEYKAAKAKLDWMEEHKITDNWRGWLGEIKDPTERMLYTFQKIYPSSIAGKVFDLLDNSLDSFGNKWAYSSKELSNTRTALQAEIAKGGQPAEVAALQTRLKELEAFTPLPEGASYGKLSGKFTNRFVRDEISTYDTPYKWMDQPVLRAVSSMNSMVKISRTVLNPATGLRNYMQTPMFMLMARVSPQEIWQAAQVIHKGADPALLKLMYERHILGVDYAAQELTTNLGHMVSGYMDQDIALKTARAGYGFLRDAYQQPDMLLRAGAFISAQKRMAERMGLELNHPSVIDAAVEAADRVTMNYATVPRAVKAARQLPFVSLFVSYTSEITKIIKNLSMDAIKADTHIQDRMHAITVLGAMATLPALLVAGFEGNLNKDDLSDWHKLRALQPDFARSRFYLPTSRDPDGRFHYMDVTAMIPADNYTQMMKAALNGDIKSAIAANPIFALQDTPLLNIATEQISGQDLHTGRPVQGLDRVREIMKEVLPPLIPPGYEGERFIKAFSQNAQGTLGLTNLRTGVQTRPSDIIASYLTGMRFANVQLSTVQRSAVSEATKAIAEEKSHLNDTVRLDVPDEQRREAMNRYTESVKQIMLQLHQKMGVAGL